MIYLAREYAQIYGMVMELLDKLVMLLGNCGMNLTEYAELLDAGLSEMKVGLIPAGTDQVVVGDMERSRLKDVKILFFVGVNEGSVPKEKSRGGILSEMDRELLAAQQVELAPTSRQETYIQKFYIYLNLTKPSRRLYLSWSLADADGNALRPSYLIAQIQELFPKVPVETEREEGLLDRLVTPGGSVRESDVVPLIPQFIEKTVEKTGAARGTVYHTVMEWMDFKGVETLEQVKAGLLRLKELGKLTEEDVQAVRPADILAFAKSGLAERMERAKECGELFREQPFVMGLPGDEVDGSDPEELVLIQGIIDAFFYEDDEIVVLDYKTDRVRHGSELREKYHAQLEYYEKALEMMTGKKVKERLIYSFTLGKVIRV